ncbi:MAG TPA: hypothetical protein VJ958_02450 [Atribacterota bacterium]|nr:hypothetical protein [Atribacterota bacterium]
MESISVLGESSQLMASGIILLALCLGIVFYSWSLQLFKKFDLQITKMKQNIDSLENLSQSIYETAYWDIKKKDIKDNPIDNIANIHKKEQYVLEEIKAQIQNLIQRQAEISQTIEAKLNEQKPEQQENFSLDTGSEQFLKAEEKAKYQKISQLVIKHLKDLLKEKEQVTAQELVYTMPDQYPLADIYRTLELMKEKNQIDWEDRNISPQSILEIK